MKRIAQVYTWALFLPAVLPLFYIEGTMYPLLAPKIFALRALGVAALALFSYLVLAGRPFYWGRLRTRGAWLPAALLALAYLASLLGVDFYHSFWSTFERGDGLLTFSVCVGYFYLLLLSAEASWMPRLFKIAGWTGSLAALYLVLQWLLVAGVIDLPFIVKPNGRVGGTMGNAAFLAAYLGMTFFAALAAAPEYGRRWRHALYAGAGLQLVAVLLTATRGTQLALLVVGSCALLFLALKKGSASVYARGALVALVVLLGVFVAFRGELARVSFEPIQRLASVSLSDATVSSRLFIWRTVSQEALSHSLLGYGAEHIDVPFDRIYDPSVMSEEWFDRSHNAYLDYFVQFGIGGLLLYLALLALVARAGWWLRREGNRYGVFLLGMSGVYAVQNFFVFDTAMTFWLLLAFAALALVHQSMGKPETVFESPRPVLGALVGAVMLALLVPVALRPLQANLLAFEAYQYQIVDVPRARAAAVAGLALGTYADLESGYNAYFMYTEEQVNRLSGGDLRAAYENAVALLINSFERYPYDARTAVYLAQVLSLAPPGAADESLLAAALERSLRLSPKRSQPWYILANLSISDANEHPSKSTGRTAGYAAARDILSRYIALVPGLSEPYFVLAQLDFATGNAADAAADAAHGKDVYQGDLATARRALGYYVAVNDFENARFFLEAVVREAPDDVAAAYDLAKASYLTGDKVTAAALVASLRLRAPAILETDPEFLSAITAYESR